MDSVRKGRGNQLIGIVDYGVGNLGSVYNALTRLGFPVLISSDIEEINNCKGLILPGVGAFKDAMDNLNYRELSACIKQYAYDGKPILGICLGMQLLYEKSHEDGIWDGLGILQGEIVQFDHGLKVPHMGWNKLIKNIDDPMTDGIGSDEYVYFVHSYYLNTKQSGEVLFWTECGIQVPAVIRKNNVIGMQFHQEKSGATGMKLLKNFGEMIG